jgi:hypothetical protein
MNEAFDVNPFPVGVHNDTGEWICKNRFLTHAPCVLFKRFREHIRFQQVDATH